METELPQAQDGSVRLLQITDTHLFASAEGRLLAVRTAESLAAVLEQVQVNEHPFDLILATGDLSQDHSPESYQRFASMMAPLARPIYWLPGNHDDGPLMTEYLHAAGISEAKQLVGEHWQVMLLDTQVRGKPHGVLGITNWRRWTAHCVNIPAPRPDRPAPSGCAGRLRLAGSAQSQECRRLVRRAGSSSPAENHLVWPCPSGV